ncbi:HNH endonuclease [Delftia sp. GW456-R20]|uniref:HNH endonuclease n=1 Tax=Delftia sp. GW456-R20 TaxID=1827145 RepID=UPI000ABE89EA|nr:HNH endonuclease signature motif containing protein [Delftia sp. GW456-R20]
MKQKIKEFIFSDEENILISEALKTAKPWKYADAESIRKKIHSFHYDLTEQKCCYCQKNMLGEFKLDIDPEHILPSSKFKSLSYTIWNLSVACKRCNMMIKKARVDFINDQCTDQKCRDHYYFIHPSFDDFNTHLQRFAVESPGLRIVKYVVRTPGKGRYTFDYFKLKDLEIGSFDISLGISIPNETSEAASSVRRLEDDLGI